MIDDVEIYYARNGWWTDYSQTTAANLIADRDADVALGVISGIAQVAGVTAPSHRVYLIDRLGGTGVQRLPIIVATKVVTSSGAFEFRNLFTDSERYSLMIMDENDTGSYNARIIDRLTAV